MWNKLSSAHWFLPVWDSVYLLLVMYGVFSYIYFLFPKNACYRGFLFAGWCSTAWKRGRLNDGHLHGFCVPARAVWIVVRVQSTRLRFRYEHIPGRECMSHANWLAMADDTLHHARKWILQSFLLVDSYRKAQPSAWSHANSKPTILVLFLLREITCKFQITLFLKSLQLEQAEMPKKFMYMALAPLVGVALAVPLRAIHNGIVFMRPTPRHGTWFWYYCSFNPRPVMSCTNCQIFNKKTTDWK